MEEKKDSATQPELKKIYTEQLVYFIKKRFKEKGLSLNQIKELLDSTKDAFENMPII